LLEDGLFRTFDAAAPAFLLVFSFFAMRFIHSV
jgi:hypothetical protein